MRGRTIECALFTWQNTCNTHAETQKTFTTITSPYTLQPHDGHTYRTKRKGERTWRMLCSVRTHSHTHTHRHVASGGNVERQAFHWGHRKRARCTRSHAHTLATNRRKQFERSAGLRLDLCTHARATYTCVSQLEKQKYLCSTSNRAGTRKMRYSEILVWF